MKRTKEFYKEHFIDLGKTVRQIAEEEKTYPNKINRELKKFGFHMRSKSETQRLALLSGRAKNPAKGKPNTNEKDLENGTTEEE